MTTNQNVGKLSGVEGVTVADRTTSAPASSSTLKRAGLEIVLSHDPTDRQWDDYLNQIPGAYFAQSALWAAAKASQGFGTLRLTVKQRDEILGGVQMLTREMPVLGNVGYVSRGPVLTAGDPELSAMIIDELLVHAGRNGTRALILQPHGHGLGPEELLLAKGFRTTERSVAPVYTLLLDLTPEKDDILGQMKPGARYNIRLSGRKGIAVREGAGEDLDAFIQLANMTGERQSFAVPSASFIRRLWECLAPDEHAKLFLAEYEGQLIAAQLAIPFGDTVVNKLTVWSGEQGKRKPNEGLMWGAIQWAKDRGYRYYDFGGLDEKGARHYLDQQEPLPEQLKGTVTSFKLGFGGQITMTPRAYMVVGNRFLRWIDRRVLANVEQSNYVKRFANRLRTQ